MILATLLIFVVTLLLLALAGAGGWMLYAGLRGRIEGDDPSCRRCGFNLSGCAAEPARCPECGTDLSGEHAVRYGRRVRRDALVLGGASLIALGALPFAISGCF